MKPLPRPEKQILSPVGCAQAEQVHVRIVALLRELLDDPPQSCLSDDFRATYARVCSLYDAYQSAVLRHHSKKPTCVNGCTACCGHWVEDVYSFEAEMVAAHVRTRHPLRVAEIVEKCGEDVRLIRQLDRRIAVRLAEEAWQLQRTGEEIDPVDLLLAGFYQYRRPCPLLDGNGRCSIYPVRPLTCRIYLSFSAPSHCDPNYINDADVPTYLLDLEEEASRLLDALHFRYNRFGGDTGLRSLLMKCLSKPLSDKG